MIDGRNYVNSSDKVSICGQVRQMRRQVRWGLEKDNVRDSPETWIEGLQQGSDFQLADSVLLCNDQPEVSPLLHRGQASLSLIFTYLVLLFMVLSDLTDGSQLFFPQNCYGANFSTACITITITIVLVPHTRHKIWFKAPTAWKLHDVNVLSGKREIDDICAIHEESSRKSH